MSNYENDAKDYIRELNSETQKRAIVAIQDAQKDGRDWQWIATALRKKSVNEWAKWGFGLFFDRKFQASVYQQIERDERCKTIDVDGWLNGGGFNAESGEDERKQPRRQEPKPGSPFFSIHAEALDWKPQEAQSAHAKSDDFRF